LGLSVTSRDLRDELGRIVAPPRTKLTHRRRPGPLLSVIMAVTNQVLIDVPMPIHTPRLTIRPKAIGDGAITSAAVAETWEELNL
jgi:hypothetical protein